MNNTKMTNSENIERMLLEEFTKKAYLDYSMYVIMDRALPYIGDGLKPVQRRIVYAMSELNLNANAKFKKSARTVGDVLGKFHPHGDTACYEAMVLMAQPFSYRYPLIQGQGNWGAQDDPKSFAAMRYTEAKLASYAEIFLKELGMGTVSWRPNFDGTLMEPAEFPARLPNILLNGTTGIAVGMSTDIPPHNINEVVKACIQLIDRPKSTTKDLFKYISGPDYPTEAEIITPPEEMINIYRTGKGVLRMRATYEMENGDIVINALPHQVSPGKVLEQIASQMYAKKLPMVSDLRDESDHEEPIRLIIVPRSKRVDRDTLMAHLFATTDLERTYRVNMNMIGLNKKPKVKGLVELLDEWLLFRIETIRKRLEFRLKKINDRIHILKGLLIAYLNIEKVIRIIRFEDNPKSILMTFFKLTEIQVEAILQMRLRHLAKLEEAKLADEKKILAKEGKEIKLYLSSEKQLKKLLKKELRQDAKTYGDARKTAIVKRKEAQAISQSELLPVELVTIILSSNGWVRAAKGHEVNPHSLLFKSGDQYLCSAKGKSNQFAVFIDSTGRSYSLPAHTLPSARGHGKPLTGSLNPPENAKFQTVLFGETSQNLLMASDAGYGFICHLSDLYTKNQKGKVLLTLPDGALPMQPVNVNNLETDLLAAITNEGRMIVFPLKELPVLTKGKGNKIINIRAARAKERIELLSFLSIIPNNGTLTLFSGKRHFKITPFNLENYMSNRGLRGKRLPRGFQNVDRVFSEMPAQIKLL